MKIKSCSEAVLLALVSLSLLSPQALAQQVKDVYSFNGVYLGNPGIVTPIRGRDGKLYGTTLGPVNTYGAIFKVSTNGAGAVVLHSFDSIQGAYPESGVILGTDGNFYGTAGFGGSANAGVLYKISPNGTYTILHEFNGSSDGTVPFAPPMETSDGSLYGTTLGSPTVSPTVYKLSANGQFSIIYTFDQSHGQYIYPPLIEGVDGYLYGTASRGGAYGCGTIFKLSTSGSLASYYSFPCGDGGNYPDAPLSQGSDGNFYGTTVAGGSGNSGTIFRMNPAGSVTILYSFAGPPSDGQSPDAGLIQSTDGKLYGATTGGGSTFNGTLYRITRTGTYEHLYTFSNSTGQYPISAMTQDTNGIFYGTVGVAAQYDYGTVYGLDMGLGTFIAFVRPTGKVGQTVQILGQGLTGASGVTFNGVPATTFIVATDTFMTAVVPRGATTGKVVVSTPSGPLTSNVRFRIIQ